MKPGARRGRLGGPWLSAAPPAVVFLAVALWAVLLASAATGARAATRRAGAQPAIVVAGASDLRPAFEAIGRAYTARTGAKVTFSFGSSGQLAQQIRNGAPFDVFASADVAYVDELLAAGVGDRATKVTYAFGRLALWQPKGSTRLAAGVADLADPSFSRIAIANPQHAPYGRAAVQALKSAAVYEAVADRLVFGENVSDAYRIATSGNADAALVSLSLVVADSAGGYYAIVPAAAHAPLEQAMVVTAPKTRAVAARAFAAQVTSRSGRAVMRRYGFVLTDDPEPSPPIQPSSTRQAP